MININNIFSRHLTLNHDLEIRNVISFHIFLSEEHLSPMISLMISYYNFEKIKNFVRFENFIQFQFLKMNNIFSKLKITI